MPVLRVADIARKQQTQGQTQGQTQTQGQGQDPSSDLQLEVQESDRHYVYQRYCHVYRKGELEDLCSSVPGIRITQSGYDHNNWYIILQKFDLSTDDRFSSVAAQQLQGSSSAVPTPLDRVRTTRA